MSRLALPPEIPAKLAKNTLYDVLCVGDSFGVDWTVFEAGISDQAKEAQARALEDGMQFSPNSKDVLRKTELAERKRKLAAARTLNLEGAPGPSVQFSIDSVLSRLRLAEDADVRAMHAALNMTEENFDTPSKPKPGRDSDARRLFAAQRLRLLMGAVPRHIAKGEWRTIGLLAGPEEFYFNRMAEAAPHLLWLLVLSSDPAYTPERLAKGIMGVEARCIMRNSRAFITRHESSAVWGERPDTGVLTDAYAIRIVLEAACRTCRDRHGRQGICAFDLVPEFEVPGVTIGDRVQVIRRCSMPDSHGRPMIHGAVKYVVPRRTLALTFFVPVFDKAAAAAAAAASRPRPMLAAAESSDSDSDSEAEREAEAAAAARALDFTEEELERARSLPRAGREMTAVFKAAIGEATASASGDGAGVSKITAEGLARAMRVAQAQAQAKGKGKGKVAYINLKFEKEDAAGPEPAEEELEAEREMEEEAALAAAADAKAARELEVAEEYAMELEREREREGEADAELAAAGAGDTFEPEPPVDEFYPLPPSPSLEYAPPPPVEEFSDDEPGDAGPRPPLVSPRRPPAPVPPASPAASDVSWRPSGNPSAFSPFRPRSPRSARRPPSRVPPRPPHPSPPRGTPVATPASSLGHMPPPPPPAPRAGRLSRRAQQRRERERQLLRDQRAEAEADHDDGQASESDGEPPRATRLELARAELAAQPREAPEIDMSKYDDVTTYSKDNKSKKEAAIQDALRLFVKNNRIVRQRPYGPNSPPTFYVELPNLFVYDKVSANRHAGRGTMKEVIQLLAMTFHKTYESSPGSFEFTFSKELEDVCPEMPVIPGFAFACDTHFVVRAPQDSTGSACVLVMTHEEARERYAGYMNTCYIQGRLPAGIEEATETCDWPTVYGMLHPFMPNVVKHLADNGYVTADEFGYAAAVLYAFNLVGPWNFCDKPVFDREPRAEIEPPSEGAMLQYCGIIKGQSGTGKSMGSAFSEHGGEEAICMVMAEGLDPKACSEEELKMRSGDAYSRNFKNVRGDDVRTKATRKVLVIVCNSFPQLENRMLEFFARVVLIPLDHKPAKKRTYLHSDIRENELPALMVAAFTFAWKIIHALLRRKASCIQAFEPAWLRAQRLGFWQETTKARHLAAVGADIENGRLDETSPARLLVPPLLLQARRRLADLHPRHRPQGPLSLGESQPALEAIAIPVAQFKDPVADVGPSSSSPHQGQGQAHPQLGAGLPPAPAPATAPQQRPGQQRIDEMLPRQVRPRVPPPSLPYPPSPRPLLIQGQGFGAQRGRAAAAAAARQAREAEERRQGLWARRMQETAAFRAELEAASARARAEAVESWRAFEDGPWSWRRASATATGGRRCPPRGARGGRGRGALPAPAPLRPRGGALAATLTWLLGGTPTASAVIGVGFGYAAKSLYAPGSCSQAAAGMRPAGR
eukprot:tig00020908_g15297.t1